MSMFAFFPWMQVRKPVRVAEFELVPYRRGVAPGERGTSAQTTYDRLLAPYRSGDASIHQATIVLIAGKDPTSDLSDEEREALFLFSELLSAAGLAAREFFAPGLTYQNRESFRLVIQGFSGDHDRVAITTRRRDGSTVIYSTGDSYRVQQPEHVPLLGSNALDLPLLQSLCGSRELEEWNSLYEAIVGFNLANTDSSDVSEHIEAVLLVGTFERLFDCYRGNEDELAEGFTGAITPTENKQPASAPALAGLTSRFKKSAYIRDMWIRDLFRLRGNFAHGRAQSRYPSVWSLRNHMLLGSFAFPLALKSKLRSLATYAFTDRDQQAIDMFEAQASEDYFRPVSDPHDRSSHPWNRILDEALQLRLRRTIEAACTNLFPDNSDGGA